MHLVVVGRVEVGVREAACQSLRPKKAKSIAGNARSATGSMKRKRSLNSMQSIMTRSSGGGPGKK